MAIKAQKGKYRIPELHHISVTTTNNMNPISREAGSCPVVHAVPAVIGCCAVCTTWQPLAGLMDTSRLKNYFNNILTSTPRPLKRHFFRIFAKMLHECSWRPNTIKPKSVNLKAKFVTTGWDGVWDLRITQWWCWGLMSNGFWRRDAGLFERRIEEMQRLHFKGPRGSKKVLSSVNVVYI